MADKAMAPALHAIVEAPIGAPGFVGGLPPHPWPQFVRLFGAASSPDVSLVVAQLGRYGHGGNLPQSIDALVRGFPHVVPGGLAAIEGAVSVLPSCCCGLESWRDWQNLLRGGTSPWLGHDPSPWVEKHGDDFLVWSDGGLGPDGSAPPPSIRFTGQQLSDALATVERDLLGFAGCLRDWAGKVAPDHAQGLSQQFLKLVTLT